MPTIDWGLLIAGLGLFMLGMYFLEQSLKTLLNQTAVKFMRASTASLWVAIPLGTVLTALMQSSSLVGLLVLAFVGAGVMPMRNALGVILGANLGTTITGWIVTFLGFSLNLDGLALPLMGVGALLKIWLEDRVRWVALGHLMLGLGLLLFGLDGMKTGVEELAKAADLTFLQGWAPLWFLLLGMLLAGVIQSSSAVVMLVLSSMHAGIVDFTAGAAMIIGADVGTTSTLLLASSGGSTVKRQVAAFHLIYNLFTGVVAFVVLLPIASYLLDWAAVTDPLYRLVVFHSSFNLVGIFLALPFLRVLADWIELKIGNDQVATRFIHKVPVSIPDAALVAIKQEARHLFTMSFQLIGQAYGIKAPANAVDRNTLAPLGDSYGAFIDRYEVLKNLEAEIVNYANHIEALSPPLRGELETTLTQVRRAVYAVKAVKDVRDDLELLWKDTSGASKELKIALAKQVQYLLNKGEQWFLNTTSEGEIEQGELEHKRAMKALEAELYATQVRVDGIGFSSLLNAVRETDESGRELMRLFATGND